MAATDADDASTPGQLLGLTRRADDRRLSPIALERWESDGGAVAPGSPSRRQVRDVERVTRALVRIA
ncbi:hypothetical protein [Mycolicibacterium sp. 120270]|uniref:hypothetical protein n=1 Tax=Mycolicibacterium sp. 120270 TaxID=3090600 RepID=UPI00299D6E6F|nr:hypothetical protein [Mycolicibacterium sp. 120270]MDX1887342.1 hypothetical protein [Mycolicibacterium sp. 120270]